MLQLLHQSPAALTKHFRVCSSLLLFCCCPSLLSFGQLSAYGGIAAVELLCFGEALYRIIQLLHIHSPNDMHLRWSAVVNGTACGQQSKYVL